MRVLRTVTEMMTYTILFPFEEDSRVVGLSFEFDKDPEYFRTVGLSVVLPNNIRDLKSGYRSEISKERELRRAIQETTLQDKD